MREEPTVLRPNGPTLPDALAADSIEKLILTTCSDSLKRHYKAIHASTANVVCLIHHSNPTVYRELKPLMEPLAAQGRLSILVLGEHVRSRIQLDIYDWIEKMESPIWEGVSVEVTIPVSPIVHSIVIAADSLARCSTTRAWLCGLNQQSSRARRLFKEISNTAEGTMTSCYWILKTRCSVGPVVATSSKLPS